MKSNIEPLDADQSPELISPGKTVFSASAGVVSMVVSVVLLALLTEMDDDSGVASMLILLLVLPLGLFVPIGMFLRSVLLLSKRQRPGAGRGLAIFFTSLLGAMLLLLFVFVVLYIKADRQPPF